MSRLEQELVGHNYTVANEEGQETEEVVYSKIVLNKPKEYDSSKKVLLIDADSILFLASYFPEDSLEQFPTDELQLEEGKYRIRNKLQEIQNNVEECYNISNTIVFLGGKGNFRYKLYPLYKANRKDREISPLIPLLKKYIVNEISNVLLAEGSEADDYVYETYKISGGNCVVAAIDKDVFINCPNVPLYNYRSYPDKSLENTIIVGSFKEFTEEESRLAIATQIITGDAGDGIPGAKGVGAAWCDKNLRLGMSNYSFTKQIFLAYLKATKNDTVEAKKQIKLFYKLLKLWTKDELKTLNL